MPACGPTLRPLKVTTIWLTCWWVSLLTTATWPDCSNSLTRYNESSEICVCTEVHPNLSVDGVRLCRSAFARSPRMKANRSCSVVHFFGVAAPTRSRSWREINIVAWLCTIDMQSPDGVSSRVTLKLWLTVMPVAGGVNWDGRIDVVTSPPNAVPVNPNRITMNIAIDLIGLNLPPTSRQS